MYEDKTDGYFSYCRTDLLDFVPRKKGNRILEIGAGSGETLLKAKEMGLAEEIVGIELQTIEKSNQSHPKMDRFIIGDIERMDLDFEENYFDVILCGDVLEHLVDPWQCLQKLRSYVREGGIIIASIPNVRYWKISMGLLFGGRWDYTDSGVLDRSHLRYFVKNTILDMFDDAGFKIQNIKQSGPQRKWGLASWALNGLTFGIFSDLLTVSYVIVASK